MAWILARPAPGRYALSLAMAGVAAAALTACGGDDAQPTAANPSDSGNKTNLAPAASKVLLVGVDGATYEQVQSAILRRELPNLAQLNLVPAATGGMPGTVTAQPPLDAPSWATVLTGTWSNRHGVTDDTRSVAPQAPSLFRYFRDGAKAGTQLGSAISSAVVPPLLTAERDAGNLDTLVDCASADSCVTQNSVKLVQAGYGLVFAQYSAPALAAEADGFGAGTYATALAGFDQALGQLLAAVAERRKAQPNEDWLVMVTTSHGLDATGATTSVPTVENRTAFIAMNKPLNAALASTGTAAPVTPADLSALPTEADIAPTLLTHAGIAIDATAYRFDGMPLNGASAGVRGIRMAVGRYNDSIELTWQNASASAGETLVLRDGVQIAKLPASATQYVDNAFDMPTGLYRFNYTLVRNGVPVSYQAQINYVKPVPLATTLRDNLATYFSLDTKPPVDAKGSATLGPWLPATDGGTLVDDNFGTKGLRVDSNVDAYELVQNGADIAQSLQFTIGLWFRTDCTQGNGTGEPIISNKNYTSGANPGIALGLFGSCEVRFNIGSGGGKRDDINGMKVSANQWAYLALSVDTVAKKFSAYVIDPVLGLQKVENKAIASTDVTKLNGLATKVWGLNDDATHNYVANNAGSLKGVMAFNDLAMWTRVLTLDELKSITASRQPLSSLNP
ncbi:LamG-like jellyroll fold domain-containing protein [Cupriavidus necator]|uniref:Type I phosphodiesterase/nucleotide pyrophosphatase n=1 Tax=Cupriavidus pinatubonensis (strain JMP 134 / LMG 1197) TaxID=264198 RepID=Q46T95_CUPPJ|nr:LamG-like jellyroll fold domain-containing protein [Cupriavidus necator]